MEKEKPCILVVQVKDDIFYISGLENRNFKFLEHLISFFHWKLKPAKVAKFNNTQHNDKCLFELVNFEVRVNLRIVLCQKPSLK